MWEVRFFSEISLKKSKIGEKCAFQYACAHVSSIVVLCIYRSTTILFIDSDMLVSTKIKDSNVDISKFRTDLSRRIIRDLERVSEESRIQQCDIDVFGHDRPTQWPPRRKWVAHHQHGRAMTHDHLTNRKDTIKRAISGGIGCMLFIE